MNDYAKQTQSNPISNRIPYCSVAEIICSAGLAALVVNFITYAILLVFFNGYELLANFTVTPIAFLNRMAISFAVVAFTMLIITLLKPLAEPKQMPVNPDIDMKPAPSVIWLGSSIVLTTIVLYIIFW